jgi:hypothetical protein
MLTMVREMKRDRAVIRKNILTLSLYKTKRLRHIASGRPMLALIFLVD